MKNAWPNTTKAEFVRFKATKAWCQLPSVGCQWCHYSNDSVLELVSSMKLFYTFLQLCNRKITPALAHEPAPLHNCHKTGELSSPCWTFSYPSSVSGKRQRSNLGNHRWVVEFNKPDHHAQHYLFLVFFFLLTSTKHLLSVFLQFLLPTLIKIDDNAYYTNNTNWHLHYCIKYWQGFKNYNTAFILSSKSANALEPFFFFSSCSFTSSLIHRMNR